MKTMCVVLAVCVLGVAASVTAQSGAPAASPAAAQFANAKDKVSYAIGADIASSFKIHGSHPQAAHEYDWISDPLPGEPNVVISN